MMEQYLALKREAEGSLLFYRMGDFFELFFDDAKVASDILDIALTARGEHEGEPVAMCGVPVHSAEGYLARLIRAGQRVAIAEQVETPDEAKARAKREGKPSSKVLVARDIVRFVTAGTLTEEALLEPRRANLLVAVCEVRGTLGLASCDISTGSMVLEECEPSLLGATLARLGPSEVVVPEDFEHALDDTATQARTLFASDEGAGRLKALHGVSTLDGFGEFTRPMLAAAGGLIAYLEHVGRGDLPFLLPPTSRAGAMGMAMDEATRTSLEILEASGGGRAGSLVATLDRCSTGAGSRLLAQDLSAPLLGQGAIENRLALVQFWLGRPIERANLRDALRALPDAEVITTLTKVKGIGVWTAEIYAMFSLGRADAFAPGDLALQVAAADLFEGTDRLSEKALREMSLQWSPWRSVAARALFAYYRIVKGREGIR